LIIAGNSIKEKTIYISNCIIKMIFALSEDFVKVADVKDIQPSQMKGVEVNGEKICLADV
jgi:hypothetical protein